MALLSSPALGLEIGSHDLMELRVQGDQVVYWQGDGFDLGCNRNSSCIFNASNFSKGSYHIFYFREENQNLYFDSETIDITASTLKQKLDYRLQLRQKISGETKFAAAVSGLGFIYRDDKKIILKNLPVVLKSHDVVKNIGESTIYLNLSKDQSVLLQKDSRIAAGGSDLSTEPMEWLGGTGLLNSTLETFFYVGKSRIQSGKTGGRILIYENQNGIGLLPIVGEYEVESKTSKFKISAPFGMVLKKEKWRLISRLSCDDPLTFIDAKIAFSADCQEVRLSPLGIQAKNVSPKTLETDHLVSQVLKLPWLGKTQLVTEPTAETLLKRGTLDAVKTDDPFQIKMQFYLWKNDCATIDVFPTENEGERQLKYYYASLCAIRASDYGSAKNNLLWMQPRLSNQNLSQSVVTLLSSDWVRPRPQGALRLFIGRDSNGYLKEAKSTYSPFKEYPGRIMPFLGTSVERQWHLFEDGPLEIKLNFSLQAKALIVDSQIPFARHMEDITLPVAFKPSEKTLVELSPIAAISGSGFPLETMGRGLYLKVKIKPFTVKTSAIDTDDFNKEAEVLDYVSGNPTAFSSMKTSDRPYTTRKTTISYDITTKPRHSVYFEYVKSRYLKPVENNQSFTSLAVGGDSFFTIANFLEVNLGIKYDKRYYIEGQKGSLLNLAAKGLWNVSPDYSTYIKLEHISSEGKVVNANWNSTQLSIGVSKELR